MHLQYLKRFYPNFNNKKILDLGCGRGDFLLECYREKLEIIGIDVNEKHVEISREKLKKHGFNFDVIQGMGEQLPFKETSFDFINCTEVLEHTNNPEGVLRECYRVLKKDGYLFVTIPNKFSIRDPHYNLLFLNWLPRKLKTIYINLRKIKRNPFHCSDNQDINNMHYYTYRQFKNLIKSNGFSCVDTKKEQIRNPKLITNTKLRNLFYLLNYIGLNFILSFMYSLLTIFYIKSFQFLLKKIK